MVKGLFFPGMEDCPDPPPGRRAQTLTTRVCTTDCAGRAPAGATDNSYVVGRFYFT